MLKLKVKYKPNHRKVIRKTDDAAVAVMRRFGAYVRTTARRSIKRAKKDGAPSDPGGPPRSQTGTLKRFILFDYDRDKRSLIVGAALVPGRVGKDAPEALEKGGQSTRGVYRNGRRVRVRGTIKQRPFMVPALEKRIDELAPLWRNAIK